MPTPVWPVDLAASDIRETGTETGRFPNSLRTPTDGGAAKKRRRYTATVLTRRIPCEITGAQKAIFEAFYETTIAGGSLEFEWVDPEDGATKNFRFLDEPAWRQRLGAPDPDDALWAADLNLEIIP